MTLLLMENLYFRTKHSFMVHFFNQFILCKASNNTTSPNIGGRPPTSNFEGDRPPKSPPMVQLGQIHQMWGVGVVLVESMPFVRRVMGSTPTLASPSITVACGVRLE